VKRTALRRRTALKRTTFVRRPPKKRAQRKPSRYRRRERFVPFMLWVKALPCMCSLYAWQHGEHPCGGEVEADHDSRGRGLSQKSHDSTVIPLCRQHHYDRQNVAGYFRGYTRAELHAWVDRAQAHVRMVAAQHGVCVPAP
jgi:hypothetical protein